MMFHKASNKKPSDAYIRELNILPVTFPSIKCHAVLIKSNLYFKAESYFGAEIYINWKL